MNYFKLQKFEFKELIDDIAIDLWSSLNFPTPKFFSIFFAFLIKDQMVNYIRLAWKLTYMLRTYRTCNPTVGFSKYEFNKKLLGGVTFFRVTLGVTWTQSYIS